MVKEVPLMHGYMALVDDEDYERVIQYKWHVHIVPQRNGRRSDAVYACRSIQISPDRSCHELMHHLILGSRNDTDHADLNGLNNQRSNLRHVTQSQNSMNRRGKISSASRYKGVSLSRTGRGEVRWRASIFVTGKAIHLGIYSDEAEAARVYDAAAERYFGEFARLNFPDAEAA